MKLKKIVFFLSIILILSLIVFLFLGKKDNKDDKENDSIDIDEVKKEIIEKVKIMSADDIFIKIYEDGFDLNNIDYNIIASSILINLKEDGEITDKEASKYDECINTSYINLSSVEDKLKLLFNEVPSIDYDVKSINYYFDKDNKKFFELCINVLDGSNFIDTYIYDFDYDEDNAYLYVSVSYGNEELTDNDDTRVTIYKDYKHKKIYKEFTYSNDSQNDDFILDESNYKEFTLYKYTFKRVDDNYYFDSLKKID